MTLMRISFFRMFIDGKSGQPFKKSWPLKMALLHLMLGVWLAIAALHLPSQVFSSLSAHSLVLVNINADIGRVLGLRAPDNRTESFRGVPFASPGSIERFAAAALFSGHFGDLDFGNGTVLVHTHDGRQFGPSCVQPESPAFPAAVQSESDCLSLNVFRPSQIASDTLLPVLVFIHGGSMVRGGSSLYDASTLAGYPVNDGEVGRSIVVTVNYRLGVFGFMSFGSKATIRGNVGFLDQQLALKWVHKHIAAFGGDPARVTLWGQSAGAASTCFHLSAPGSRGLFQRAILQSGDCWSAPSPNEVHSASYIAAEQAGCKTSFTDDTFTACLRNIPARSLLAAAEMVSHSQPHMHWSIDYTDPSAFSVPPHLAIQSGSIHPEIDGVILGVTSAEATGLGQCSGPLGASLIAANAAGNWSVLSTHISLLVSAQLGLDQIPTHHWSVENWTKFNESVTSVMAAYRLDPSLSSVSRAVLRLYSDQVFSCPMGRTALYLERTTSVFVYRFMSLPDYILAAPPALIRPTICTDVGPGHSDDLPFLFPGLIASVFGSDYQYRFSAREEALAAEMQHHWTTFAAYGNPNFGTGNPWHWQAFLIASPVDIQYPPLLVRAEKHLSFGAAIRTSWFEKGDPIQCDVWNSLVGDSSVPTPSSGPTPTSPPPQAPAEPEKVSALSSESRRISPATGLLIGVLVCLALAIVVACVIWRTRSRTHGAYVNVTLAEDGMDDDSDSPDVSLDDSDR